MVRSGLKLSSPARIKITAIATLPGPAEEAGRVEGDKDFPRSNHTPVALSTSEEWQTQEIELPAIAPIIHLRVQFPPGSSLIRKIDQRSGAR